MTKTAYNTRSRCTTPVLRSASKTNGLGSAKALLLS